MLVVQRTLRRVFSSALASHSDSDHNNSASPFEFTDENYAGITRTLLKYPPQYKKSAVLSLLYLAQEQCSGWVPLAAMNKIAKILELTPMEVYEVASFYTMFNREPVGKFHLQVCGTTPCMIRGSAGIITAIEEELGILCGQTTRDGLFTLTEVECLGACVNAPMLQVNGQEVYEDLTPQTVKTLLKCWAQGENTVTGPQIARNTCEGVSGRTTLHSIESPPCRDFSAVKAEYEAKLRADTKS